VLGGAAASALRERGDRDIAHAALPSASLDEAAASRLPILDGSPTASLHRMEEKTRRGIQSVEIGSELLVVLARHVKPMALKDLAKAAHMSTGKAHPYLVSFLKVGFVMQDAAGCYELGPLALQLGLTRLQRLNPVKVASPLIEHLATETEHSVALSVWGNLGPTIVRLEDPVHPLHVNLRVGTVMSLAHTATGRLFAAYLPAKVVEKMVVEDLNRQSGRSDGPLHMTRAQVEEALIETRRHGLSRTLGQPIPGIDAFSAPVFDSGGHIALGITVMGPSATFDSEWNGSVARPLRACSREVSRLLGFVETT
jgi:DNA-binding IclR family transcriptional regulator